MGRDSDKGQSPGTGRQKGYLQGFTAGVYYMGNFGV